MTINKSQGQSFNRVGVFLPEDVFSHGQLYVAFSRGRTPGGIKSSTFTNYNYKVKKEINREQILFVVSLQRNQCCFS
ncbi:hypothetical protein ANCCAN_13077 [Ancylostoma caninum]|uniref:ATP-dependent DNA helicase n=1 Tax=Ancylostoma caninum TaxID=29170 RepID=A0A368G9F0_ANCCA|nr:hypothetical protein ANCCAN_13077 [Ancylostoma caninum]